MLKVEWKDKNIGVDRASLAFGFDTVQQLMDGEPEIKALRPGNRTERQNNLIIFGDINFAEVAEVVEHRLNHQRFDKGDPATGTARLVLPLINDPALSFRAGVTVHKALGTWSSLPHRFEREEILSPRPMPFYEKFAYITDPPGGWGVQVRTGHVSDGVFESDVVFIRDRDIVDIPLGSHPVSAGPGVRLAYIWVYWGGLDLENRREKFAGDKAL